MSKQYCDAVAAALKFMLPWIEASRPVTFVHFKVFATTHQNLLSCLSHEELASFAVSWTAIFVVGKLMMTTLPSDPTPNQTPPSTTPSNELFSV